ncbi:hypothetical protein [Alicyclobacillus vulcanalis]|uniref:DoxX-like family protein n=1 Tax=Alicyclobacillus vulcanalis TaxID=252246 RepID=A0A1N7KMG9_9BACL|nr:hypothetical protein [Alicyclobacillus vulcanalis]SIS62793.1 hypothetical protein SAMN05421799_10253 [Alicyclobacillus vulcanalis]
MRAWKLSLASVSFILACYGLWSSVEVARAGAIANIPQLEAAGAAEMTAALGWALAGALALWRLSASAALHTLNVLWTASLAWYYQDETVWLWSGACALLAALSVAAAMRRRAQPAGAVN